MVNYLLWLYISLNVGAILVVDHEIDLLDARHLLLLDHEQCSHPVFKFSFEFGKRHKARWWRRVRAIDGKFPLTREILHFPAK
jgi:hypothetical protein